jgi:hypothetical protein
VIDSIAALFRFEFTKEQSIERAKILFAHAQQLHILSEEFKLPVLIVNEVTDYFGDDNARLIHSHPLSESTNM